MSQELSLTCSSIIAQHAPYLQRTHLTAGVSTADITAIFAVVTSKLSKRDVVKGTGGITT